MQDVDAVPRAMDVLRDPSEDHGRLGGGAAVDGNEEHARVPPPFGPRRGDWRRGWRRGVGRLARALADAVARGHGGRARGKMRVGNPRRAPRLESRRSRRTCRVPVPVPLQVSSSARPISERVEPNLPRKRTYERKTRTGRGSNPRRRRAKVRRGGRSIASGPRAVSPRAGRHRVIPMNSITRRDATRRAENLTRISRLRDGSALAPAAADADHYVNIARAIHL